MACRQFVIGQPLPTYRSYYLRELLSILLLPAVVPEIFLCQIPGDVLIAPMDMRSVGAPIQMLQ